MKFMVRKAVHEDIPQMCGLLSELFSIESDFRIDTRKQAKGLGLLLSDNSSLSAVYVAESGDEIVGMCSVQTLVSTAEGGPVGLLEDLIVRKDQRGKGIGTRLLAEIFRWCEAHDILRLQLLRDADNESALQFYSSCGWSSTNLVCMRRMF